MKKPLFVVLLLCALGALLPGVAFPQPPTPAAASPKQWLPLVMTGRGASANDGVPAYDAAFQYGINPGYFANGWGDKDIHQLCYDAGCRSARNSLPDRFIGEWGANIRLDLYKQITQDMQFREITVFLGEPRDAWRDTATYDGQRSKLWQGMYEPIWDDGANGTPVNDANRFALYVWTIVKTYGPYIRFYEIINEPDYTYSSYGWAEPGTPGSWWNGPPQPKDLPNLNAPVYNYIRLLRIAYEVVKREDPDAFVTPGGIGYESFLDALLRYTDNPDQGKVTAAYPLRGGAYFDALSYHSYPQFGTRHWDGQKWVPDRFSDKAAQVFVDGKKGFETVLSKYGYDGAPYPEKVFIVTELNVARKQIGETLGGIELQRNFTIKALVKAQQLGIRQLYWFVTGESKNYDDPSADSFNLMGFYENLTRDKPGQQKITGQGIANRTTFQQLYGWAYDSAATAALALPATIDGAAFRQGNKLRYVLWAKTNKDRDETASATISLPGSYTLVRWDGATSTVSGTNIALSGAPVFLTRQ
jgi:hypothetical protein